MKMYFCITGRNTHVINSTLGESVQNMRGGRSLSRQNSVQREEKIYFHICNVEKMPYRYPVHFSKTASLPCFKLRIYIFNV